MIRIDKSTNIPAVPIDKGLIETKKLCDLYLEKPNDYINGVAKFEIASAIYGYELVKKQLIAEQHGKCCFCEADFTANSFGDVEHYRPKGGYKKNFLDNKLNRPGYYWLAYNWDNLFFSCEVCNRREKKSYFPIAEERHRAVNHTQDILLEQPLLIHPSLDNPEKHIGFKQHIPIGLDERGEVSIEGYGLNREELNRSRERYYWTIAQCLILAKHDPSTMSDAVKNSLSEEVKQPWPLLEQAILKARVIVQNAAKNDQPFAGMIRSNFPNLSTN